MDSPQGDNLLFEFDRADSALESSLEFQAFVLETNERYASEDRMQFRIGMHSGEVVVDSGRIYGSGINIAARLERLARPGGICISGPRSTGDRRHAVARGHGSTVRQEHPGSDHAFFVEVPGQAVPTARRRSSTWPAIAVIPFEAAEGDGDAEYLADGLSEDIITTLAMWRQFPTIARNSTFTYKGRTVDPVVAGPELGAEYVVVGSLRRLDQRVRIAAQLFDTETGHLIWADRWNTTLDEVFDTGSEIAQAICVALRPELLKDMSERAMRQAPADMTAWDYALRGLWHLHRPLRESGEEAVALLSRAVRLDPASGFAHAHLAHAHYRMLQHHWTVDRELDLHALIEHAERAVACDPMDANGYLYLSLACSVQGKRDDALTALRRAVELNPSLPVARSLLGQFLGIAGRTEEGLRELEKAIRLSPRDPQLWTSTPASPSCCGMRGGTRIPAQQASGRWRSTRTPRPRRPSRTSLRRPRCSATCHGPRLLSRRRCASGRTCPSRRCERSSPPFPSPRSKSSSEHYAWRAGRPTRKARRHRR